MVMYLIFLIFSMNLIGGDFEVKLYYQDEVILNEPCYVTVEIKNISGREIIISHWWKNVKLEVRRADGKKRRQVIPDEQYKLVTPMVGVKVKPGEVLRRTEDIFGQYEDEPGDFLVRYKYVSIGEEVKLEGSEDKRIVNSWIGEIISEEVKIKLNEPEGIDREAYEYFKGHPLWYKEELLEKYPTSTYAGWALLHYHFKYNVIDPFNNEKAREEIIQYKDKILEFLNVHKDFLFSGNLSSSAAYICSQIGDYNCACNLYKEALTLKWDLPQINEKEKEKEKERIKKIYEKLKKEGKCK